MIKEYTKELGIPGHVIHHKWKNFADGRSHVFQQAYEQNLADGANIRWLDADEVYINSETKEFPTKKDKEEILAFMDARPNCGRFNLITHFGSIKYPRWNLVVNDQLYMWKCPVHEYLVSTRPTGTDTITSIYLWARKEGNSSRNPNRRFEDVLMLQEAYNVDPKNGMRELFYLAQTLGEMGLYDRALHYYNMRLKDYEKGWGYDQEKYIGMLRSGRILKDHKNDSNGAIECWKVNILIISLIVLRLHIPRDRPGLSGRSLSGRAPRPLLNQTLRSNRFVKVLSEPEVTLLP